MFFLIVWSLLNASVSVLYLNIIILYLEIGKSVLCWISCFWGIFVENVGVVEMCLGNLVRVSGNIQQKTGKHFAFLSFVGHPGLEPGTSRL